MIKFATGTSHFCCFGRMYDLCPQALKSLCCVTGVVTPESIAQLTPPLGQRGHNEVPVGNALGSGNTNSRIQILNGSYLFHLQGTLVRPGA